MTEVMLDTLHGTLHVSQIVIFSLRSQASYGVAVSGGYSACRRIRTRC